MFFHFVATVSISSSYGCFSISVPFFPQFTLLNDGMDIHTLAIQMGTSIAMIERHYSHLTPRLRKEMLTGKRYELRKEEFYCAIDDE